MIHAIKKKYRPNIFQEKLTETVKILFKKSLKVSAHPNKFTSIIQSKDPKKNIRFRFYYLKRQKLVRFITATQSHDMIP